MLSREPFSGRLTGNPQPWRTVVVISVEQRLLRPRDASSNRHRSDALHLSEVRTHLEVRDMPINFRGRSEGLVPDAVRHGEPGEHVPVIGGVSDEAPIAEVRGGVAELDLCVCRIAKKKIGKIISGG